MVRRVLYLQESHGEILRRNSLISNQNRRYVLVFANTHEDIDYDIWKTVWFTVKIKIFVFLMSRKSRAKSWEALEIWKFNVDPIQRTKKIHLHPNLNLMKHLWDVLESKNFANRLGRNTVTLCECNKIWYVCRLLWSLNYRLTFYVLRDAS